MRVRAQDLETFVRAVWAAAGAATADIEALTSAVVEADLRGVSSHGCARLPAYARAMAAGIVNPAPSPTRIGGGGAIEVLDGDNGLGLVLGRRAMSRAVELARLNGIGAVAVRNGNHTGMLAVHLAPATSAGMIGLVTSNAPAIMAPYGGRDPLLSNAPMAYGIPTRGDPLVLDMAASATNRGRIRLYAQAGEPLPPGWALDEDGADTTDPAAALRGVVLPMGGHKGYGLAVVNEVLAGVLAGATLAVDMPRDFLQEGSRVLDRWRSGLLAIAIEVGSFLDPDEFLDQVGSLLAQLRSSRPAPGSAGVLVPGDVELERRAAQLQQGVEVGAPVVAALDELAQEMSVRPLVVFA
jgi:LDH2 family malate/lactate/ureidoglycolate dehydrogenase